MRWGVVVVKLKVIVRNFYRKTRHAYEFWNEIKGYVCHTVCLFMY